MEITQTNYANANSSASQSLRSSSGCQFLLREPEGRCKMSACVDVGESVGEREKEMAPD